MTAKRSNPPRPDALADQGAGPDPHELYERCVQSPDDAARLLRAIHGGKPLVLAEDFAGTAAVSRAWIAQRPRARAVATDLDAVALARAGVHKRLRTVVADVTKPIRGSAAQTADDQHPDIVFVGNFSIGYLHTRDQLVKYLKRAHKRLQPRAGVFVCDTYGGESAYMLGALERTIPLPNKQRVVYTWEQREADPVSGMVTDALHFAVFRGSERIAVYRDAFVYRWRLWSVPELRDAMHDAGFAHTSVYQQIPEAIDDRGDAYVEPIKDAQRELDDSYIVCIAARSAR